MEDQELITALFPIFLRGKFVLLAEICGGNEPVVYRLALACVLSSVDYAVKVLWHGCWLNHPYVYVVLTLVKISVCVLASKNISHVCLLRRSMPFVDHP